MSLDSYDVWAVLFAHAGLAIVVLAASAAARWWLRRGHGRDEPWTAMDIAYLNGGLRLAGYACIAEAHRLGLVEAGPHRTLVAVRTAKQMPERTPRLLLAVRNGLQRPQSWPTLALDPDVQRAGAAIGSRLVRRGWMLSATRRRRLRLLGLPGLLVAGWCLVHVVNLTIDFTAPRHADLVLGLVLVALPLGVASAAVADVPPVTRAGDAARRRARDDLADRTDGASLMARVAAIGEPVMWDADPEFAKHARADSGKLAPMPRLVSGPIP